MKRFFGLAAVSASQIIVTFIAQWVVIRVIGAGVETDALFAAATVPQLLVSVLVVSISQVLMTQLALRTPEESARIASGLTLATGVFFVLIGLALLVTAGFWLRLLFPALHEQTNGLLITLAIVAFVGMVFQAMEMVAWSFHHSRGAHLFADGTRLIAACSSLVAVVLATPRWGVVGAAAAITLAPLIHLVLMFRGMVLQLPRAGEIGEFKAIFTEIWPPVAGALYYRFDVLIDRVLTGLAGAGALSVYYLGHQMGAAVSQIMGSSIANPALPAIAGSVSRGDRSGARREIRRRVLWILALGALIYGGFAVVGLPVLTLLFGDGALTEGDIKTLFWLFVCLAGLTLGGAVGQVTAGSFYALGQSRTPTLIGVVTYTVYVPLKVLAFRMGGLTALALSVTAFYSVSVLIQSWFLSRRLDKIGPEQTDAH